MSLQPVLSMVHNYYHNSVFVPGGGRSQVAETKTNYHRRGDIACMPLYRSLQTVHKQRAYYMWLLKNVILTL